MRRFIKRRRPLVGVLLVVAALGQGSCGDDSATERSAPTAANAPSETVDSTTTSVPTATSTRSPDPERTAVVSEELIGAWVSTGAGGAEIIYRFHPDGTYEYAGVLLQERDTGTFSFERSAEGHFRVMRNRLVLEPEHGTEKVEDPDVPSANREGPVDVKAESFEWAVDGAGAMSLTDASGSTISFERQ